MHAQQNTCAITHVNVIPMSEGGDVLSDATVIVTNERIASVNGQVPEHARIIDGRGKWLIPGLIDMHVHIPVDGHFNTTFPTHAAAVFTNTQDVMTPFVAAGVTTAFDLNSRGGHFGQRNEILRGDVIGPRMALAAMINGGEGSGRLAHTPADGRQSVRMAKAEGYEFIKVYSDLDTATFRAIVDEAYKQGLKVVGHIPDSFNGNLEDALAQHFDLVAHAEEFAKQVEGDWTEEAAQRCARLAKELGTWVCPTLTAIVWNLSQARSLDELKALPSLPYVHPLLRSKWLTANKPNTGTTPERVDRLDRMVAFNAQLVKAFKEAGVPMVAGTDAGSSSVVWGFSLHDELELLVGAGLTPEEALVSATRLPATWLGLDSLIGTVEAGKYADLLLLDADPRSDIKNTRRIAGVFINGRWLDRAVIDVMLADLAKRNAAARDQYEWKRRDEY